jgi:hypothetical protein
LYTIVLYNVIVFLTARNNPGYLSKILTNIASIHTSAATEWLQVPLAVELFISGTVIAFNLLSTEEETETYFGGGCTRILKEQELIAQQQ